MEERECGRCDGTGYIEAGCWPCEECGATGEVTIPPRFCTVKDHDFEPCDYPNCCCA